MSKIYSDNKSINHFYLSKLDLKSDKKLSLEEIKKILVLTYNDFEVGKNSVDELSEISNYLHTLFVNEDLSSDLEDVLHYASELNFYVRNVSSANDSMVPEILFKVRRYLKN
jgi:hypothetical protein